jgi:hypothetical protein
MRGFSKPKPEPGTFVHCSERILLGCWCGERIVLLGLEEDWRSERTIFECNCGARLTLADRVEEGARGIGELLRGSIRSPGV